jgi:hypothetical protein
MNDFKGIRVRISNEAYELWIASYSKRGALITPAFF